MHRPSLSSAALGVVALILMGTVAQRVAANEDTEPADFTPVVITPAAIVKPAPTAKPTHKPDAAETSGTATQIKPTPRNITDDAGDDHGGTTADSSGSDDSGDSSGSDGSDDGGSGEDGDDGGSSGDSGSDDSSDSTVDN